ncbi:MULTISPECIES: DUF4123 domain-containing protein [unclassified Caballeronia]|uniref:DUF4123 domain-containing protein n=1 Tax=unclassified Caballeronia TaxID=2646786 RepID=UPI0028560E8D|nr:MULTISPECIES: DUF4123 domain-containing protein [unclassified Caballeronia]MDR5736559.1 DUF4123 domain-containing protein [Caballeronia sp. LZ016]MDR5810962.1 DUF4123 domain-containing protein [Caballeronia sp. LZ019]
MKAARVKRRAAFFWLSRCLGFVRDRLQGIHQFNGTSQSRRVYFRARGGTLEASRPSVVWLFCTDHAPTLAAKLRERLNAVQPDGQEVLLRYWDPRVLHELATSLRKTARADFFGAALKWL